ncbi:efflux RND transporter periplasmic adaptor subunit [Flavobacterium sp. 3HN19-14]|uniref:efflux RND transporter periplasmic adaptor subunit n=1 Tax=Flavobacterium sp. 3HN19-14 TaxID=3448133 RepID=UPI003EE3AFF0
MITNKKLIAVIAGMNLLLLVSCHTKTEAEVVAEPVIPVTVTTIDTSAIASYIDLNATTSYIIKNTIKANTTGYIDRVNVASNDFVKRGRLLFSLKTREAKVLGNTVNKIDPSLNFGKAISINATSDGFVSAVNVQQNDYVQEGDALAVINDTKSFAIVLSLPYELKQFVKIGQELSAFLPDGTTIKTRVEQFLPTVDAVSQTQNVILKYSGNQMIPENLVVKVRINKASSPKTISLPKAAILSDETETDFWVMKMIDNNTAVKIPIKKGIETNDKVEILSPGLIPMTAF